MSFLYLQEWRLHSFSGHLLQCLSNLRVNNLTLISSNFLSPSLPVAGAVCCPVPLLLSKGSGLVSLCLAAGRLQVPCRCHPLILLVSRLPRPISPRPECPVLHQFGEPPWSCVPGSLVRIPELDTSSGRCFPWTKGRGDLPQHTIVLLAARTHH